MKTRNFFIVPAIALAFVLMGCPGTTETKTEYQNNPVYNGGVFNAQNWIKPGGSLTFEVIVNRKPVTLANTTWSIEGAEKSGTSIVSTSGILTVDITESVGNVITVKAVTAAVDAEDTETIWRSFAVTVVKATVTEIKITADIDSAGAEDVVGNAIAVTLDSSDIVIDFAVDEILGLYKPKQTGIFALVTIPDKTTTQFASGDSLTIDKEETKTKLVVSFTPDEDPLQVIEITITIGTIGS